MKIKVSDNLRELASLFEKNGKLFIVGGYVRNALIGVNATDIDLASKLPPEKIVQILKDTKFKVTEKNLQIGYVKIRVDDEVYEHTTFRKDNYHATGTHKVESVDYVEDLRQDAMRRDFSMNAIYYDILSNKVIDIYSGILDIKNEVVRTVEVPGYVLAHDGTRILRMIRFASELNFKIDFATLAAAKKYAHLLNDVSPAKKKMELMAILKSSKKYPISKKNAHIRGLNYFNELHLWNSFFVSTTKIHLKMVKKANVENRVFALLIDIIDSVKPDCIEYFIKDLLGKNGYCESATTINHINYIICGYYDALNLMNNKQYFFKYFDGWKKIGELLQLRSKKLYSKYKFFHNYITKHKLPVHIKDLAITGADLQKECPEIQEKKYNTVLLNLLSKVFDGELQNDKETLLNELKDDGTNFNFKFK